MYFILNLYKSFLRNVVYHMKRMHQTSIRKNASLFSLSTFLKFYVIKEKIKKNDFRRQLLLSAYGWGFFRTRLQTVGKKATRSIKMSVGFFRSICFTIFINFLFFFTLQLLFEQCYMSLERECSTKPCVLFICSCWFLSIFSRLLKREKCLCQ